MIIEALAAITGVAGVAKPIVEDHYQQKYRNEHIERIKELDQILEMQDSPDRANRLHEWLDRVCVQNGHATGFVLSGNFVRVPVEYWLLICGDLSEKVMDNEVLQKLQSK